MGFLDGRRLDLFLRYSLRCRMPGAGPFDSCATILTGLAKRLGLEPRLVELRLQQHWHEIIGEPIASHTWPVQIRFKKLYLVVKNSVWLQQLTFLKPTLLAKLNAEAGTEFVTEIVLRVGEMPSHTAAAASTPAADRMFPLDAAARAEAASHAAAILDPDLREQLTEVISRYPSRIPFPPARDPSRVP
jgi:hypothetical protein